MSHTYEIAPHGPTCWKLRLLEDGEEVGGGVFPAELSPAGDDYNDALEYALTDAYQDALQTAEDWIFSSRPQGIELP